MTKKILLPLFFFLCSLSYAQFNESAPWMKNLNKNKTSSTLKSEAQSYSLDEISDAFHNYWKDRDHTVKGSGFKPYMRWENYWSNFVDSNGRLPSSKELWDIWKKKNNSTAKVNPISNWTSIGPVGHQSFSGRLPGQGRVNAIAVDPNNTDVWYIGAPSGGIWKSTNSGGSWTNLFDDRPQIGVSGIAIDPNNSNIIYISTGDDDAGDSYSVGVFKSLDGGTTWNETGLNPGNTDVNSRMNEIIIDPSNSQIIWVGTNNGLFKSVDGAITWERKQTGNITDFKLKPGNSTTVYAVNEDSFYKSTDGETFSKISNQQIPDGSGRLVIGVSAADPNVVYVLSADILDNDSAFLGLYRSTDSGTTFTKTNNTTDIFESNQAWFDLAIEISPTNANEIYVGCLNIWKSTNGGNSFTKLNEWFINNAAYTHADIHTIKIFDNKVFTGTDGGLYVSDDDGTSFEAKITDAAISQFYKISVSRQDASKISGGTQDNAGFISSNGIWNVYTGGDGMEYEIDPNNDQLVYGFAQFGSPLFITTDSGQTVGQIPPPKAFNGDDIEGNWITPLTINSLGEVFAGYDAVYKLVGSAWEKQSNVLNFQSAIDDLETDPIDPMILYAAEGAFLYRSTDGGVTFSVLEEFSSNISDIAINNTETNIIYVTTSLRVGIPQSFQQTDRGVFKVTIDSNGNAAMENITLNIPTEQAFFGIIHQGRHTDNPIYVATSLGVYRLDDTLTEWEDYFTGLPNVAISDLEISLNQGLITASTYGRGIWQSPIPTQVPDNDIEIVSVTPDNNNVICESLTPEIVVKNNGTNVITAVEVSYSINDDAIQTFTETKTINPDEEATISIASINGIIPGKSTLKVTSTITDDAFPDNNSISTSIIINGFGQGDEINTFETPEETLIAFNETGNGSLWEKGVPSGTLLNQVGSGAQVYGTNLDGNHPDGIKAILMSNCYDFTGILAPILKFKMAYDLEDNFDIVYVEYSTSGGENWNVLGNVNSQPNWYNSDRTNISSGASDDCQNCPGAQWTGTNAIITEYAYDFTANANLGETSLTSSDNIIFRIIFQSDPGVNQEGVVIDDFVIEGSLIDDEDDDNDGILDVDDNCQLVRNVNQLDTDNDGEGDVCDNDDDGDGILDVDDNCPLEANTNQLDTDNDGIGDVCDTDIDNDGVPNDIDLCPNTPINTVVDVTGCEIFSLPSNNFSILITGESCISSNNGSIGITAMTELDYTASLSSNESNITANNFTATTVFNDLAAGSYSVCITVAGQVEYENCFDINISEPEPLSVSSKVSTLKKEVTLSFDGGKAYIINLNSSRYETSEKSITLPLSNIENTLSVKTDKDCQGIYEETIILNSGVLIYPNPVANGNLTIYLGNDNDLDSVKLSLFNMNGAKVYSKPFAVKNNEVKLNVDNLPQGIYLINIKAGSKLLNYKIIRK